MRREHLGVLAVVTVSVAVAALGCSPAPEGREGEDGEEVGGAQIALEQVPSDVGCIEITAQGARTVVRPFAVGAGMATQFMLRGLSVGPVHFSAVAFAGRCETADRAAPTWTGDPVTVTLVAGEVAAVKLTLRRPGRANVSIDFTEEHGGRVAILMSAPGDAQVGDLVPDPAIIAIDGVDLAMPRPSVVTRTWLEPTCYPPVSGTRAIASMPTEGFSSPGAKSSSITFRTKFRLPADLLSPSMKVTATADDRVEVVLNGFTIGDIVDAATDLCDPPSSFDLTTPGVLQPGENLLDFRLVNDNAPDLPLSLSYKVELRF